MKLYATITSDRASKGQGGNKKLEVVFKIEQGKGNYVTLATAELTLDNYPDGERYYLQVTDNRTNRVELQIGEKKGEKQKGECNGVHKSGQEIIDCPMCSNHPLLK